MPRLSRTAVLTGAGVVARSSHAATLLAGGTRVLLTGGGPVVGGIADLSAEVFDSATGTFTATAGGSAFPRSLHTATLLDDGSVLVSGTTNLGDGASEIYHP